MAPEITYLCVRKIASAACLPDDRRFRAGRGERELAGRRPAGVVQGTRGQLTAAERPTAGSHLVALEAGCLRQQDDRPLHDRRLLTALARRRLAVVRSSRRPRAARFPRRLPAHRRSCPGFATAGGRLRSGCRGSCWFRRVGAVRAMLRRRRVAQQASEGLNYPDLVSKTGFPDSRGNS